MKCFDRAVVTSTLTITRHALYAIVKCKRSLWLWAPDAWQGLSYTKANVARLGETLTQHSCSSNQTLGQWPCWVRVIHQSKSTGQTFRNKREEKQYPVPLWHLFSYVSSGLKEEDMPVLWGRHGTQQREALVIWPRDAVLGMPKMVCSSWGAKPKFWHMPWFLQK